MQRNKKKKYKNSRPLYFLFFAERNSNNFYVKNCQFQKLKFLEFVEIFALYGHQRHTLVYTPSLSVPCTREKPLRVTAKGRKGRLEGF